MNIGDTMSDERIRPLEKAYKEYGYESEEQFVSRIIDQIKGARTSEELSAIVSEILRFSVDTVSKIHNSLKSTEVPIGHAAENQHRNIIAARRLINEGLELKSGKR